MLSHLYIKNYALIDEVEIDLPEGFITLTGETGAGKSIILGALGMLSGNRADTKVLRKESVKAVIEATFSRPSPLLKPIFDTKGLEWNDEELILRRELSSYGKSRIFANDSPVTLAFLTEISPHLLDIHSQHNNLILTDNSRQRQIIDSYGDYHIELAEFNNLFCQFSKMHARLAKLRHEAEENSKNKDLLTFKIEQLDRLNLKKGEFKSLEQKHKILSESTEIKESIIRALSYLQNDEGVLEKINHIITDISGIDFSAYGSSEGPGIMERLNVVEIELRDIAETLQGFADMTENDPRLLPILEQRLSDIYHLAKKFGCKDPEELVEMHGDLRNRLCTLEGKSPEIIELEAETKILADSLRNKAERLTELRTECAKDFANNLLATARPLGLSNLRFEVEITKGKIGPQGQDKIEFLCSFNKNQPLLPLSKVASGGEISRLMLAIKGLIAKKIELPTMIFDEIDAGVSGEIAARMGLLMRRLADNMQIITVTHLPQVAAKGTTQFFVYKTDTDDSTVTSIRRLEAEERVQEIARILSADKIDEAAVMNARSLLK